MKETIKKLCIIAITILMTLVNLLPNMAVHAEELSNPERASIIKEAEKHLGKPYVWGAVGPDSFDCSGYTQYVFKQSINFPLQRTAENQRQQLISSGKEISKNDMSKWNPGDLMFFGNHGEAEHVAIYYGNGKVIHAIGDKVQINNYNSLIDKDGVTYQIMTVIKTVEDFGAFTILKQDENGNALAGAIFKITTPSGTVMTRTTPSNGKIVLQNIIGGKYVIQEVTSPNGYLLDNTPRTITVKAGDKPAEHVYSFVNKQPTGEITLTKYNDDKSAAIAGTTYRVTGPNSYNQTFVTDANGKITLKGLSLGNYTFVEIQAASGYLLNSEPITVTLTYKDQNTAVITGTAEQTNTEPTANITFKKVDKETSGTAQGDATLKGAVYQLTAAEDIYNKAKTHKFYSKGDVVATRNTDANGNMASVNGLPLGFYQLKEKTASEGYLIDPSTYDIHCDYEGQSVEVITRSQTSKEQVKKQAFQILKISTDESGEAVILPSAQFTVKLKSEVAKVGWDKAKTYNVLTTDNKGYAKSIELPYGTYTVKETKVPDNVIPVPDFEVKITEDSREPQVWRVFNDAPFKALIKAVKVDAETGKTVLLPDTTFKIKNLDTGEYVGQWVWFPIPHYVDTFTTDKSGTVTTPDSMGSGNFQLEEIHAPNGYVVDHTPIKFTVSSKTAYEIAQDGVTPVITVTKKDVSVKGKINVTKIGEQLVDIKTAEDGTISFVYEDKPVNGAKFIIKAAEDILSADNQGDVIFKKGTIAAEVTTKDGKAQTVELPLGKYTVEESVAGDNFVLNKEIKTVELKYKDEETAVVFTNTSYKNERQKIEVSAIKKDKDNGQLLQGAVFGLYAKEAILGYEGNVLVKEGTLIEQVTTDSEGKAVFNSDLPLNLFEIRENKAPIGYASTDQVIELDAAYQGQDIEVIKLSAMFENEITKTEISKKDATTSEELPGAHLTLKEKNGPFFETWISGNEPHIIVGLEPGKTYELYEVSSPYGFAIAQKVEFTVSNTGDVQKVELKDELVMGKLRWTKTGEVFTHTDTLQTELGKVETPVFTKQNIVNAEISIYAAEDITLGNDITYYEKDELIETLKSGSEAVESKELPVGKYYYVESETPDTFVQDTEKHYFEVEDNQSPEVQIIESELFNTRAKVNLNLTKVMEEHPYYAEEYKDTYKSVVFGIYARSDVLTYTGEIGIEEDTLIATCGIDESGKLTNVPDLPIGEFYLKEIETDRNYVIDHTEHDFAVTYEGKDVKEINLFDEEKPVVNELKRTDIIISKIDKITKEPLSDVEFTLYDKNMKEILKAVSDEDGIARFKDMPNGVYYCKETKARKGYELSDEIIKIELTGDSKDNQYHVTMTNVLLPASGESINTGDTTNIAVLVGTLIISSVMVLTTIKLRRRNGKKK